MTRALIGMLTAFVMVATVEAQTPTPTHAAAPRVPQTLKMLNQRLPEVRFVDQPFEQVIDWLAEFTQMNVVVRWQALEDAGLKKDTPISLQVKNLRMSQVLWLIMNEAAGSELTLAYRASGNLLVISTADDLGKEVITKVYDVADLLLRVPQMGQPDYTQNSQGLGQQGQGGGGGQSVFGNNNQNNQQQNQQQNQMGNDMQMEKLLKIIRETIEPDSWQENGGKGQISTFGNLLIVRNTILVHQRLGGYLTEGDLVSQ
jgi:hypothetical protein